jgi:hypothetical protein
VQPSWSEGQTAGHIFGREPSNDYFIKNQFLISHFTINAYIFLVNKSFQNKTTSYQKEAKQ